jgi:hypothetical protein
MSMTKNATESMTKPTDAIVERRRSAWLGIATGLAAGFAIGLLTAKSFPHSANAPLPVHATTQDQIAAEPVTFPIVPSPVIEPHPVFFYGTGDGNGSYLPNQ